MATIFYSWQSDTPSKTNRSFIKDALDRAIKSLAKDLDVAEPLRVDQDTQDVPGNPSIADTILRKTDACDIFVPDLTFVARTDDGEPVPNPNVLIELGYAMKSKRDERFIFVMNEAFGKAKEGLPFDLRHKRWPICYTLPEDASPNTRQQVREQLVKELATAIRLILDSGSLRSEPLQPTFQEIEPKWKSSSFLQDGELLAKHTPLISLSNASDIIWHNGPQTFLRLIPTKPIAEKTSFALQKLARQKNLIPFGGNLGAHWERNKYGAVVYLSNNQDHQTDTRCFTQVFKNGEIWGLSAGLSRTKWEGVRFIPYDIEEHFEGALKNYLQFAQQALGLDVPIRLIAGLSNVEGFTMALPPSFNTWERSKGNVVEEEVVYEKAINDYNNLYTNCYCHSLSRYGMPAGLSALSSSVSGPWDSPHPRYWTKAIQSAWSTFSCLGSPLFSTQPCH